MRTWTHLYLTVLLLLSVPGASRAQINCPAAPADAVVIDLATGSRTDSHAGFAIGQVVPVYLINANPFTWEYRVDQLITVTPDPALTAFLGAFLPALPAAGGAAMMPAASGDTAPPPPPGVPLPAVPPPPPRCSQTAVQTSRVGIDATIRALSGDQIAATTAVRTASGALETLRKSLEDSTQKLRGAQSCNELAMHFATVLNQKAAVVATGAQINAISTSLIALQAGLKTLGDQLVLFENDLRSLDCTVVTRRKEVGQVEDQIAHYEAVAEKVAADLAAAQKLRQELLTRITALENVAARGPFQLVLNVPGLDAPGTGAVKVFRKEINAKAFPEKAFAETVLRFGGKPIKHYRSTRSRFALTAGAVFSGLDVREFEKAKGFSLNADGSQVLDDKNNPVFTDVVAESVDDERFGPLFAFHTRVGESFWIFSGTHLTLGLASPVEGGDEIEGLLGLSLSFAEERGFLTFGAYRGQLDEPRAGFYEGRALPTGVDKVPTQDDHRWDWAVALTWRIQ